MSDQKFDDLDAAFEEFRGVVAPYVAPAGVAAAFATARRRRTVRSVALAVVAVVLVIAPIAGVGLTRGDSDVPVPGDSPSPSAVVESATPSVTPSPATSESATLAPARQKCASTAATVPAGGIPLADLCGATLDVPAWNNVDCLSGRVTFDKGAKTLGASFFLNLGSPDLVSDAGIAYPDLDGDGDAETVVLLSCGGEMWISQVIALERSGSGFRTLGRITQTTSPIKRIFALAVGDGGTVRVQVADWNAGLGDVNDTTIAQRQWRGYRLAGTTFTQVDGPTSFPPNPRIADLAISGAKLDIGPKTSPTAPRDATFEATIRNLGPSAMAYRVTLDLPVFVDMPSPPAGCSIEAFPQSKQVTCTAASLPAGQSRRLELPMRAPAGVEGTTAERTGTAYVSVPAGHGDPANLNSTTSITITIA